MSTAAEGLPFKLAGGSTTTKEMSETTLGEGTFGQTKKFKSKFRFFIKLYRMSLLPPLHPFVWVTTCINDCIVLGSRT